MLSVSGSVTNPSTTLSLPPNLSGGNLPMLFRSMGLRGNRGTATNEWIIRDDFARTRQTTNKLVWAEVLAGPSLKGDRFDLLTAPDQDEYMRHVTRERVADELSKAQKVGVTASIAPMLYASQLQVMAAEDSELRDVVRECHERMSGITASDNPDELLFPGLSTHWISTSKVLYTRVWLPAIMMRLEHDPALVAQLESGTAKTGNALTFMSNHELIAPGILYGNYLGPLLACTTPQVWSVHCTRLLNSIIFNLGRTVPGSAKIPMDPLDLLPHRTASESRVSQIRTEPENRAAWRDAIDWWAMRLNQLFVFLSDPATFRDAGGRYEPYCHQNWLMNTAELFDRVTSAMRTTRDPSGALVMTFSALDLVSEKFLGGDMGAISVPAMARKTLEEVRQAMPPRVAEVLIPGAENAVDALERVADGFFLNTGKVEYTDKRGAVRKTPLEAVGPLMRARRNAVHGFGGPEAKTRGSHELLAQHRGDLPPGLVLLPYLYLLKVLCNLDSLRIKVERSKG